MYVLLKLNVSRAKEGRAEISTEYRNVSSRMGRRFLRLDRAFLISAVGSYRPGVLGSRKRAAGSKAHS